MKASKVCNMLTKRVPEKWSYEKEPYGAFDVNPDANIRRVLYCVTPTPEVQRKFVDEKYDLLVSHHPYVVGVPMVILHTALDCCPGGLNDQWADYLGIDLGSRTRIDKQLGWAGTVQEIDVFELTRKVKAFAGDVIGDVYSRDNIKSIVVCTGLGGMVTDLALATGADCYVTGQLLSPGRLTGFKSVIEIGHTLSERCGLKVIQDVLKRTGAGHGLTVHGAGLDIDVFGQEIFKLGGTEWKEK
jgi:putative NIF3 family GTP cyclohydrolase 1 type 2